jgi:hypothetical protein
VNYKNHHKLAINFYESKKTSLFYKLTDHSYIFYEILSANGHAQLNVKAFTGRSAREVTAAVVKTIHTAQEANVRGYKSSTLFNQN